MRTVWPHRALALVLSLLLGAATAADVTQASDPLPSWNQGPAKRAIVELVARVTKKGGPEFVPPAERIAAFDNDGTLWAEQPMYVQVVFAMDRVKALAPQHPDWNDTQPFKAALEGDLATLAEAGASGWYEIMLATQAGTTTGEFESAVRQWLATARHPRFNRPYTDLVYQPMLEVMAYLRNNGFKTFIVSGGDIDFMRPWVEKAYGVPPEQVVGSSVRIRLELRDGKPVLAWLPTIDLIDDVNVEFGDIPGRRRRSGRELDVRLVDLRERRDADALKADASKTILTKLDE